jgi:Methyltransferase domain
MLLVFASRDQLIELAASHPINHMVELGVYEGEFSEHCYNSLDLKRYTLVDFWDYDEYSFVLEDSPQMLGLREVYSQYFRNDPKQALKMAYEKTRSRFAEKHNVEILKMDIAKAANRFADASLDFIYLDGNHTYEFVLRDLYTWFPKLRSGGLFVCNDFFESPGGARQNLGVIPAFTTFSKRYETYPIALTSTDWSDFYFSNAPTSDLIVHFKTMIYRSGLNIVEVPDEFVGCYHHEPTPPAAQTSRIIPSFVFRRGSY